MKQSENQTKLLKELNPETSIYRMKYGIVAFIFVECKIMERKVQQYNPFDKYQIFIIFSLQTRLYGLIIVCWSSPGE